MLTPIGHIFLHSHPVPSDSAAQSLVPVIRLTACVSLFRDQDVCEAWIVSCGSLVASKPSLMDMGKIEEITEEARDYQVRRGYKL